MSVLNQINFYPLSEFDGKMKTKDWSKAQRFPATAEARFVEPDTFFDQLPEIIKAVPALPGEESLYRLMNSVMDAANKDPQIKKL